ncbi:hypothetical protein [Salinithrix halophila]|uniref:Uncharacterized protein n=1 Tax=Salinithrix halophila TaxID=1485204 RepID=A0ABV8JDK5_9BACL
MGIHVTRSSLSLNQALYRLLYHRTYRQAFLDARHEELQLSIEDLKHLRTVDKEELIATSKTIARNLLAGNLEHSGGLRVSYPGVFQELQRLKVDLTELMYSFMESPPFNHYAEVPFAGRGICIEEAFYSYLIGERFFIEASPNNALLLTHEFLTALLSILVINKDPAFRIDTDKIQHNGCVFYAVQTYPKEIAKALAKRPLEEFEGAEVCWLYAAASNRLLTGPVTPVIVEMLQSGSESEAKREWNDHPRFHADELQSSLRRLREAGLIAP